MTYLPIPPAVKLPWLRDAACRDSDTRLWFADHAEDPRLKKELRKTCFGCPVLAECQDYAVKHEKHGFWGGMTPQERGRLRLARKRKTTVNDVSGKRIKLWEVEGQRGFYCQRHYKSYDGWKVDLPDHYIDAVYQLRGYWLGCEKCRRQR